MNFSNKLRSFLTAACVVLAQIIAINAIGQPEIVHAGVILYGLVVPLVLAESKKNILAVTLSDDILRKR